MKINNQTPLSILIFNCQNKVIATAKDCTFMNVNALHKHLSDQASYLKNKSQQQRFAHLRPKRALVQSSERSEHIVITF